MASVQNEFSLLQASDRPDLLRALEKRGIGYLCHSPLGKGLLTGTIDQGTRFHPADGRSGVRGQKPRLFRDGVIEQNVERSRRLGEIADRLGVPAASLALRWPLEQAGITAVIAGSRNPDHVRSNASAGELKLEPDIVREIERVFDLA
jgi:aryl-alcohol dehydrogenase-like predicted oxidoreductase